MGFEGKKNDKRLKSAIGNFTYKLKVNKFCAGFHRWYHSGHALAEQCDTSGFTIIFYKDKNENPRNMWLI